jgi:hypothetical protein
MSIHACVHLVHTATERCSVIGVEQIFLSLRNLYHYASAKLISKHVDTRFYMPAQDIGNSLLTHKSPQCVVMYTVTFNRTLLNQSINQSINVVEIL